MVTQQVAVVLANVTRRGHVKILHRPITLAYPVPQRAQDGLQVIQWLHQYGLLALYSASA